MPRLKLLPLKQYRGVNDGDPIRFYYWPVIGGMYKKRVELCLAECSGGARVLEVGFGTGLSFLNLHEMYAEIHGIDLTAQVSEVESVFKPLGIPISLRNGDVLDLPYADGYFDTVLLISILEHLRPDEQQAAFRELSRVLKPGGQVVYGVPVERPLMVFLFKAMGVDIREHHFSTEKDVRAAAQLELAEKKVIDMPSPVFFSGAIYQVGHFTKAMPQHP